MQLNRDFRERQGEGWERPDAIDQRFKPDSYLSTMR